MLRFISERVQQMCLAADVKLLYLPPYSPNLNPIEEFFAELKASSRSSGTSMKTIRIRTLACSLNGVGVVGGRRELILDMQE
jgi:transposase